MLDNNRENDKLINYDLTSEEAAEPSVPADEPKPAKSADTNAKKPTGDKLPRGYVYVSASELDGEEQADDRYFQKDPVSGRDYMPIRNRRHGRVGIMGGVMYGVFIISVSIILACMAWMFASDVLSLNKEELTAVITLPKSIFTKETDEDGDNIQVADIDYVATALKDAGIIEYKFLFKLFAAVSDAERKLSPGSYELSTMFDYRALVKKMQVGSESQLVTKLTFPEGYTMEQIFQKLEENEICSMEDLYEAAANYSYTYSFIDETLKGDAARLEGFLFPDTYDFYQGEQASSVINKFLRNFHYKLTADMLAQAENLGMSMYEIVNVAAMIEKEAANNDERATIASVIYNRINAGMPLQIDATIQYILPERKAYLTDSDLTIDSPYNTYLYSGLPKGPVANPGIASINAALKPASTRYYYYALDMETMTHKFFATYNEHEAFKATQDYSTLE